MMTDDDRRMGLSHDERLVRVETELEFIKNALLELRKDVSEIKEAAHMGKGAWAVVLRLGAFALAAIALLNWRGEHFWPHK